MFIDSHSHLFAIEDSKIDMADIEKALVFSYDVANFDLELDYCKKHEKCACGLGIYPEFALNYDQNAENFIKAHRHDIVAIGEIGLDSTFPNYSKQIEAFLGQIALAKELNLPISVHLRNLEDYQHFFDLFKRDVPCVLHAFHGDMNIAKRAIDLGCYISFSGNLTYKRNVLLRKVAKIVPDAQLLIETDSPSMLPAGLNRGEKNVPQNIVFTAKTLATVRGVELSDICLLTSENAKKVFKLEG